MTGDKLMTFVSPIEKESPGDHQSWQLRGWCSLEDKEPSPKNLKQGRDVALEPDQGRATVGLRSSPDRPTTVHAHRRHHHQGELRSWTAKNRVRSRPVLNKREMGWREFNTHSQGHAGRDGSLHALLVFRRPTVGRRRAWIERCAIRKEILQNVLDFLNEGGPNWLVYK